MLIKQKLFNKFIDLEFTKEHVVVNPLTGRERVITPKISFLCPSTGIKPNITISGRMLPDNRVNELSIRVVNFTEDIDLEVYKYIGIRAGYRNGPYKYITGQIRNCFIEKPNPEGVTVFECVIGDLETKNYEKEIVFSFLKGGDILFSQLFSTVAEACDMTLNMSVPKEWQSEKCKIAGKTYTFKSISTCITWLKSLADSHCRNKKLPALTFSYTGEDGLTINGTVKNTTNVGMETVILDQISSAIYWGGFMTIKAPWNPLVTTTTKIQMPSTFFRGRMGSMYVTRSSTEFTVNTVEFVFSTREENSMTIKAVIEGHV